MMTDQAFSDSIFRGGFCERRGFSGRKRAREESARKSILAD
jgi:hypothetical protein